MSKDKANVIPFPGTKLPTKDNIDKLNDELLMQKEEVEMIESTIDEVAIDLIRRLVDIGIDINKKEFYGDLAMITELVRGLIYRDFKREHLATVLIDKIIDIQYNEKGEVQPVINYSRVLEQKDMPGQEGEKEIHFEPDFEIPIPPEDDDKWF